MGSVKRENKQSRLSGGACAKVVRLKARAKFDRINGKLCGQRLLLIVFWLVLLKCGICGIAECHLSVVVAEWWLRPVRHVVSFLVHLCNCF